MYNKIIELLTFNVDVHVIAELLDIPVEQVCAIEEDLFTVGS